MCATWNSSFESSPATGDDPSDGDDKIRETRSETRVRMGNEHGTYNNAAVGADGSQGADFAHRLGSAVAYFQAAAPTQRPDAATALGTNDKGRIWEDSDNYTRYVYDGSTWQNSPQRFSAAVTFSGGISYNSGTHSYMEKRLSIGDWNMNTGTSINIPHGLGSDWIKIRHVQAIIRNDDNDAYYPLDTVTSGGGSVAGNILHINSTNIRLTRGTTKFFDDTDFDSTSYNRGWVHFIYEV
jgi:hypothetical protein